MDKAKDTNANHVVGWTDRGKDNACKTTYVA